MRRLFTTLSIVIGTAALLNAQDLPKPSPYAEVEQRVGLTDIEIEYSRPGVKDREIWGELVPYEKLWRAGANKATHFENSAPIQINGKELAQGEYSLFIVPHETGAWEVIWNTETELWGTGDYDESKDALRVMVTPEEISCMSERLAYHFIDVDMSSAVIAMDWAGKRLAFTIEADPSQQVMANIKTAISEAKEDELWRVYRNAAGYAEDNMMTEEGLEWIKKSVELKENWYSYWVYANLLAQNGDKKDAVKKGEMAISLGKADAKASDSEFTYEERITDDISEWKSK